MDDNSYEDTPSWAQPGRLVRKKRGWTALKVVSASPSTAEVTVCYSPDYAEAGETETLFLKKLVPFNPHDTASVNLQHWKSHWPVCQCPVTGEFYTPTPDAGEHYTPTPEEEKTMTKPPKRNDLYQIHGDKNAPLFAHFLTENSDGHWVMERADGDKAIIVVEPDQAEKVLPYTIRLRSASGKGLNYKAPAGRLSKGAALLSPAGGIFIVDAIDTKYEGSDLSTLQFDGDGAWRVLLTAYIAE